MKKRLLVLALGMSFSTLSFAATGELETTEANKGQIPVTAPVDGVGGDCALLKEDVVIGLSNSVKGGYFCDTATNTIAVSMCHPNGRKFGTAGDLRITYTASSAGGKIQEDAEADRTTCTAANALVAATAKAGETTTTTTE